MSVPGPLHHGTPTKSFFPFRNDHISLCPNHGPRSNGTENEKVELICDVTYQKSANVQWLDPNGKVVSTNCQGASSMYTVDCSPPNAPIRYTLVFKATWGGKGKYTCKCDSTGISMSTELTVKGESTVRSNANALTDDFT
jgi:hypothetical protein